MTTSPLANLADQTAATPRDDRGPRQHRGVARGRTDDHRQALDPRGAAEVLRGARTRRIAKRPGRSCKRPGGSLKAALEARRRELRQLARAQTLARGRIWTWATWSSSDVRWPASVGHPSLVAITQRELEDVFVAMGFTVAEGPEVESDWYNFEALNIPPAHPARGLWDTFYVELGEPETVVLRTHTSPTQIHLMEEAVANDSLPIHSVMPGRCYRRDTPDSRHLATFHQIEGLVVDRGISFADLAGVIETFTRAYFGPDIESRLRPGYFPFTEPSAEFEVTCTICRGEGCRTCSQTGWIELGGCGVFDPAVLAAVGIDGEEWSGFAFGFGIDRCAQMRHEIADMRALIENDTRFLEQFS